MADSAPPIDPNAPDPTAGAAPWSWVPDSWRAMLDQQHQEQLAAMALPPAGMQPGLGIPAATLDAAASSPAQPSPHPLPGVVDGLGMPQPVDPAAAAPPIPPLGAPDAITGAGFPGSVGAQLAPLTFEARPDHTAAAQPYGVPVAPEQLAGTLPSDVTTAKPKPEDPNQPEGVLSNLSPEQARELAIKDPIKFATLVAGANQDWQTHYARQQALLDEQNNYQAQMALKARVAAEATTQAKMDTLYKRVDALIATKVDPNRYLNSRTTTRKVLDFIGAIAGGAAAGQVPGGNGVNRYTDDMQKEIDRDIEAQKADIENKRQGYSAQRGMLAEEFARTGSMYQAQEAVRLAAYTTARNDLLGQQQLYDPAGRRAVAIGQAAADMNGRIVAAQQALHQQQLDLELKQAKTQLEYMTQQANERHAKADEATARANTAMVGWGHAITKQNNLATQAQKDRELDQKDAELAAKKAETEGEGTIGGIATGVDDNGQVNYTNKDGTPAVLTQKDGKTPLVIHDKEQRAKLATMMAAGDRVNDLSNKLAREIAEWGGQSGLKKSPHWQIMQGDYTALALALHGAKGIEGFRPGTTEILKELTSDVDPTSFLRDATAGIQNAKNNINADIDTALRRQAKYTGPKYAPLDTSRVEKLPATPVDKRLEGALADPAKVPDLDIIGEFGEERSMSGNNRALDKLHTLGMTPTQVRLIDEIAADLKSKDQKVVERAASDLENIRSSSGAPGARAYAGQLILNGIGNNIPMSKDGGD